MASLVLYSKAKRCGPAVSKHHKRPGNSSSCRQHGQHARTPLGLLSRHCSAFQCGVAGLKTRAPYYANATLITPSAMSAKGPHGMLRPRGRPRRGGQCEPRAVSPEPRPARGEPKSRCCCYCTALHWLLFDEKKTQFSSESWRQIMQRCTS